MFTFENIGFSNTVGDFKYLICADCDMGPIGKFSSIRAYHRQDLEIYFFAGYHVISTKKNYVALLRVKHEK